MFKSQSMYDDNTLFNTKFLHNNRGSLPLKFYTISRTSRFNTHSNVTADHDHGRNKQKKHVWDLNEKMQYFTFDRNFLERLTKILMEYKNSLESRITSSPNTPNKDSFPVLIMSHFPLMQL